MALADLLDARGPDSPVHPARRVLARFLSAPLVRPRAMLLCGFLGALTISVTAPVRREAAHSWRLVIPGVPHPGNAWFSALSFIVGMSALALAWVRLTACALDQTVPLARRLRLVLLASFVWIAPIALAPPLLSNDVYSYAAQGELASRGFDPAVVGPNALGGGPFMRAADSVWWNNPAPYGPVWNKIAETVVVRTGHDPALAIWGFRTVVLLALAASGLVIYRLCRASGRDPAFALSLALANPVVIVHLVGGMHNEAVMLLFMLLSIYALRCERPVIAFALMVLAAAIKLPAAVGLAYLGWHASVNARYHLRRLLTAGAATLAGVVCLVLISFEANSSLGWVKALKGTGKIKSTFSPPTMVGQFLADLLDALGLSVDQDTTIAVFRFAALLFAGGLTLWLMRRSERNRFELYLGLSMVTVVLFGPVLWPWYSTIAFVILAVAGVEHIRMIVVTWSVALAMFVFPTSVGTHIGLARFQSVLGLLLFVVLTLLSIGLQYVADPASVSWLRPRRVRAQQVAAQTPGLAPL